MQPHSDTALDPENSDASNDTWEAPRPASVTPTAGGGSSARPTPVMREFNESASQATNATPPRDSDAGTARKPRASLPPDAAAPKASRFRVHFPEKRQTEDVIIETPLMVRTATRTLAIHCGSPLIVWTGPSRNGKSVAARWLRDEINRASDTDPNGFRAVLFEYGGDTTGGGNEMKRVIRSVYQATVAKLDEGLYRQSPSEDLALHVVKGFRAKNIQMLMVDEAGLLKVEGLRALVTIRDVAEHHGWPLSVVLIGMDDLPNDIARLPQIERRVHDWCYFAPYSLTETYELLRGLDPQFAKIDLDVPEQRDMIAFIQKICGGLPGLLAPFLRKLHYNQSMTGGPLTLTLLRAVHMITEGEHQKALSAAASEYKHVSVPAAGR